MLALLTSLFAAVLQLPTSLWFRKVNEIVPDPYLDEVFHVRQVQTYWAGDWWRWDPKITTPPGLYFATLLGLWVPAPFLTFLGYRDPIEAGILAFRAFNYVVLTVLLPLRLAFLLRETWNSEEKNGETSQKWQIAHTALNICLFPVLFFFCALYYTDVYSILTVLGTVYRHYRQADAVSLMSKWNTAIVVNGLLSLSLRQTNIFWVAIYLGGLQVVRELGYSGRRNQSINDVFLEGWVQGRIYDPIIDEASIEDYFNSAVSIIVAAASSALNLLPTLWPYLTLLASFGIFVIWNGGVVLGDKDNHIASLHLTQMLYIWPYIIFFSWPLALPHLLSLARSPQLLQASLPRLRVSALILTSMFLAVRFNTVIHPFTLADNRHYTFYVFRILCLRHPATKYLAVPVYFSCAWLALTMLVTSPLDNHTTVTRSTKTPEHKVASSPPHQENPVRVSHILIYLAATSLSLITAPLVEPRYFILPWIIWRLHYRIHSSPALISSSSSSSPAPPTSSLVSPRRRIFQTGILNDYYHLWPLALETAWFLLVNGAVGWMFLYRGFEWPQEPGKVQRFMW